MHITPLFINMHWLPIAARIKFKALHLPDAFIQSDLHCIQVTVFFFYILSAFAFPGNRTHDLGVASAMLYQLSYRKALMFAYKTTTGSTPLPKFITSDLCAL